MPIFDWREYAAVMTIDYQSIYIQLGRLAEAMPELVDHHDQSTIQWLGRASALISAFDPLEGEEFESAIDSLVNGEFYNVNERAAGVLVIFYRVLAVAELRAPAAVQGTFIPAGNSFDALAALSKVLSHANSDVLIVDPYMDEKTLTDFAPLAKEGVSIRLLADAATYKPTLRPASQRWVSQYGGSRPLNVRLANPRMLHDRLIAIDKSEIWVLTQSLNALAARSPATIVRVDPETTALKIAAYESIWDGANAL